MFEVNRNRVKISVVLLLVVSPLILILLSIGAYLWPFSAMAQEPEKQDNRLLEGFSAETLAAFGLTLADIEDISALNYTLNISNIVNDSSVNSGDFVTFTVTITNQGPDEAKWVVYYDNLPAEMQNVNRNFSSGAGELFHEQYSIWLLSNPIPKNGTVVVSITGKLVSAQDMTVKSVAGVHPFGVENKVEAAASVNIAGHNPGPSGGPIFLPLVFKAPPIIKLYFDDFSNNNSGWIKNFDVGSCEGGYSSGEYRIEAVDEDCWVFAPKAAEWTIGAFEVEARRKDGDDDKFAYGLYINGQNGDENYYRYRVWPKDDCGWEFRKRANDKNVYEKSGGCDSAIKRDSGENKLKLTHAGDGTISIYINDKLLHSYQDSSPLAGKGTGLYVRGNSDDIDIRFDNFTVHNQ